ncbi:alpha/beta hydrolase fold domain-containing protein [Amycolatopsis rhabdoformis]|uniref:Alpha/beta hydrolase fold domain-containing protein n=1 Tax=Amycolatopsis rhabdoformis TaxID=1448059 RepID=A0ABZ1HU34_9PSEU|nr:alpha/beta hydrolase fold domain-containing protein [Amycolatopsis rhabdoformis]WSE25949.1 alpha/beta hydrolase fold domain-containing protein [Amycolatopsis rhabdoformis]
MTATRPQVGPPLPFDPELEVVLEQMRAERPALDSAAAIPALREERATRDLSLEEVEADGTVSLSEVDADGVPLVIGRPTHVVGDAPVLYWMHGGGMILGGHRGRDLLVLKDYAVSLGLAFVSVDYRVAPEHPHPAPVEDCYTGLKWTLAHAGEFGIDPLRTIVGGASAGGGLAAAVALLCRDRGGPGLLGQLLLYPMLDDRNDTPSSYQMAGLGVWDRTANDIGWTALLGPARGGPDVSPYAAPARATDLTGLPPAFLDVGTAETFRDEVLTYATRLLQAGVQTELHVWPGAYHGFDGSAPDAALSVQARAARTPWLRRILS